MKIKKINLQLFMHNNYMIYYYFSYIAAYFHFFISLTIHSLKLIKFYCCMPWVYICRKFNFIKISSITREFYKNEDGSPNFEKPKKIIYKCHRKYCPYTCIAKENF